MEVFEMKKIFVLFVLAFFCLPLFALQYQVTNYGSGAQPGYPSWSLDGTKIAYHAKINGKFDIYTISSTGGGFLFASPSVPIIIPPLHGLLMEPKLRS
jgi:hypothetical protein